MRTLFPVLAALTFVAVPETARADDFHLKDDPSFSVGARVGLFHLADDKFDVTWLQLARLDLGWSPTLRDDLWFPHLRLHGLLLVDRASLSYREDPMAVTNDALAGIHRADVRSPFSLTIGGGAELALLETSRLQLRLFVEYAMMARPAELETDGLTVEVNGLQIDVARAVEQYARLTFDWRTLHAGLAAAVILRPWNRRTVPYVTAGLLRYRAAFAFEDIDPRLESALLGFGVEPEILGSRSVAKTKFYATTGARIDLSAKWSLETDAMIGRVDGAWLYAFGSGAVRRWDF